MDDLKLYEKNDGDLEGLLHTVKMFSDDINAPRQFKREKLAETSSIKIDENTNIEELDQEGTYKYL